MNCVIVLVHIFTFFNYFVIGSMVVRNNKQFLHHPKDYGAFGPSLPALPTPLCDCGLPAFVKQSRHPESAGRAFYVCQLTAYSVGWFVSLLVREEVLLAGLCERKILFQLKIYDRLR